MWPATSSRAVCLVDRPEAGLAAAMWSERCVVSLPGELLYDGRAGADDVHVGCGSARGRRVDRLHLGHDRRAQGRRPHPSLAAGGNGGAAPRLGLAARRPPDPGASPLPRARVVCRGSSVRWPRAARPSVFERFEPALVLDAVARPPCSSASPPCTTGWPRPGGPPSWRPCGSASPDRPPSRPICGGASSGEYGVAVLERYGMSETLLTLSNPLEGERRPGSVGLPAPRRRGRDRPRPTTSAIGELMVRGPSLCRGYWKRPDASGSMWERRLVRHRRSGVGRRTTAISPSGAGAPSSSSRGATTSTRPRSRPSWGAIHRSGRSP